MEEKTASRSQEDQSQVLFVQLVTMLYGSAMQQMGKVVNPLTNKIERNLELARVTIDMLAMLEEKTKGNLSDEEARFLSNSLFELRMNYVDEVKKETKEEKEAKEEKKKEPEERQSKQE